MPTYLDKIIAWHLRRAAADERSLADLIVEAEGQPPTRAFAEALRRPGLGVIAEIKRRSPSKGQLAEAVDPAALGRKYAEGGAVAISVLTDGEFFGGSREDLAAGRTGSGLPTLRKDFTVSGRDLCDARLMGADAALLIVAALDEPELVGLLALAEQIGLATIVEVHDEEEANRACEAGAQIIGINQRDLQTFEVDTSRAVRVAKALPGGVVKVAESGVTGAADARVLAEAGFDAVLVGESLMRSPDPAGAVREMLGAH